VDVPTSTISSFPGRRFQVLRKITLPKRFPASATPIGGICLFCHKLVETGIRPAVWTFRMAVPDRIIMDVIAQGPKFFFIFHRRLPKPPRPINRSPFSVPCSPLILNAELGALNFYIRKEKRPAGSPGTSNSPCLMTVPAKEIFRNQIITSSHVHHGRKEMVDVGTSTTGLVMDTRLAWISGYSIQRYPPGVDRDFEPGMRVSLPGRTSSFPLGMIIHPQ
jgi:hypothetical protein